MMCLESRLRRVGVGHQDMQGAPAICMDVEEFFLPFQEIFDTPPHDHGCESIPLMDDRFWSAHKPSAIFRARYRTTRTHDISFTTFTEHS